MDPRFRSQRRWQILEQFPRKLLFRIGRAARASVQDGTRKNELLEALCALPETVFERALVEGLARQDLQALCKRLGYAGMGSQADLAARILAAVDDSAVHAPRWRPFAEARAFAQRLKLTNQREWYAFARGDRPDKGTLPADIPVAPHQTYAKAGWASWGDFLGTGFVAHRLRTYRPYEEARTYARSLGLASQAEWHAFVRGHLPDKGTLPADLPRWPNEHYAKSGWTNWGDFLGTGFVATCMRKYRPFDQARAYARSLGLASQAEWYAFARGHLPGKGTLPVDIPVQPHARYAKAGWNSWGDFLGTGFVAQRLRTYRPFRQARAYTRSLGLTSREAWRAFVRGHLPDKGTLPADIPRWPNERYANAGWTSWGDFLGTATAVNRIRKFRPFRQARAYARSLDLASRAEWYACVRGDLPDKGTLPADLPRTPHRVYATIGWTTWGDFLGTGNVSARLRSYRSFAQARAYARSLGLASQAEWYAFVRGHLPGNRTRPADIPVQPHQSYAKTGWTSWGDFLGTGNVAPRLRRYRSFRQARAYARSLSLTSQREWYAFVRGRLSGKGTRPADIPARPDQSYAGRGWAGYGDWLGTGRMSTTSYRYRSYTEASIFVRALGIRTKSEWLAYCRGERDGHGPRPLDIPSAPDRVYRGQGWVSWGDFLGTNVLATFKRTFRTFAAARAYARKLGLRNSYAWKSWCAAGERPTDIPADPNKIYRGHGWVDWHDFLGAGTVHHSRVRRRNFAAMRTFVRGLGLCSSSEYRKAKRHGHIPEDMPLTISRHPEWKGWADFLGRSYTGRAPKVVAPARARGRRG